jgi:hypothetical protein
MAVHRPACGRKQGKRMIGIWGNDPAYEMAHSLARKEGVLQNDAKVAHIRMVDAFQRASDSTNH